MKVLVSGISGYLGHYLAAQLSQSGHTVSGITRSAGRHIPDIDEIYQADITQPLPRIPELDNYDVFIHLAGANEIDSQDPKVAINSTSLGTKHCLDFSMAHKIPLFIYFSTIHVYGAMEGAIDENSPINCLNDYALTHYFAEEYLRMAQKKTGQDYIIYRPSNIFGAPLDSAVDRWSLVPMCFCKDAIQTQNIELRSSGKQARDFISIQSVSRCLQQMIQDPSDYKNSEYNICSGESHSIYDVAELVSEVYEEQFQAPCAVNVLSDQPKSVATLQLNSRAKDLLQSPEGVRQELRSEITRTFELL